MRSRISFKLKKPEIPVEYRQAFISLLKSCFERSDRPEYSRLYSTGATMKPFTFGVYLVKPVFDGQTIHLGSKNIFLNFSSYGDKYCRKFIDSLMQIQSYPLPNGNSMTVSDINIMHERIFISNTASFKTISPVLVRMQDDDDYYLTKNHALFIPQLEEITRVQVKELLARDETVKFTPLSFKDGFPVKHYGTNVQGNTGTFKIEAKTDILEFIYKAGIGSRRSQGFGMLDVI